MEFYLRHTTCFKRYGHKRAANIDSDYNLVRAQIHFKKTALDSEAMWQGYEENVNKKVYDRAYRSHADPVFNKVNQ